MESLKKIACFFGLAIYILGAIGGTCYLFYVGQPVVALAVVLIVVLAAPAAAKMWNYLNDDCNAKD